MPENVPEQNVSRKESSLCRANDRTGKGRGENGAGAILGRLSGPAHTGRIHAETAPPGRNRLSLSKSPTGGLCRFLCLGTDRPVFLGSEHHQGDGGRILGRHAAGRSPDVGRHQPCGRGGVWVLHLPRNQERPGQSGEDCPRRKTGEPGGGARGRSRRKQQQQQQQQARSPGDEELPPLEPRPDRGGGKELHCIAGKVSGVRPAQGHQHHSGETPRGRRRDRSGAPGGAEPEDRCGRHARVLEGGSGSHRDQAGSRL
mmetsp:Transcript_5075/g.14735  ORF Transcript_5075/g.14735 Transcript_5075/m.14735 type:complete len:257 (-) Transcript_5075:307-1077(-)